MIAPLGFYVVGLLFCSNPDVTYKYRNWFEDRKPAERVAQLLSDGKWFYNKGHKCIYKDIKVVPEK